LNKTLFAVMLQSCAHEGTRCPGMNRAKENLRRFNYTMSYSCSLTGPPAMPGISTQVFAHGIFAQAYDGGGGGQTGKQGGGGGGRTAHASLQDKATTGYNSWHEGAKQAVLLKRYPLILDIICKIKSEQPRPTRCTLYSAAALPLAIGPPLPLLQAARRWPGRGSRGRWSCALHPPTCP